MSTYLLTWNPKKSGMKDSEYEEICKKGDDPSWSCRSKKIKKGDRVFFLCQGDEPRGILGSGNVISVPQEEDKHWDKEQARSGKKAFYVKCRFDTLLDRKDALPRKSLDRGLLKDMHWNTQSSGISIPPRVAEELEKVWRAHLKHKNNTSALDVVDNITEAPPQNEQRFPAKKLTEGEMRMSTARECDRNPQAREECLDHYGTNCCICNFNFKDVYGDKDFIHVHHLKPLADIGKKHEIDPIEDLRPVCANCHAAIHFGPPYTIEEIKKKMDRHALIRLLAKGV